MKLVVIGENLYLKGSASYDFANALKRNIKKRDEVWYSDGEKCWMCDSQHLKLVQEMCLLHGYGKVSVVTCTTAEELNKALDT